MRHTTLLATAFTALVTTSAFAAELPGKGITVKPAQSTISEETFQTLLVSRALEKLGYNVESRARSTITSPTPPSPLAMPPLLPPTGNRCTMICTRRRAAIKILP